MQSRKGAQGLSPGVGSSNDSPCSTPHRFAGCEHRQGEGLAQVTAHRRRKCKPLYNMGGREPPHRAADKEIISCLLLNEQYEKMEKEGGQ